MFEYFDYSVGIPTAIALWGLWVLVKAHERRKARKAKHVSGK